MRDTQSVELKSCLQVTISLPVQGVSSGVLMASSVSILVVCAMVGTTVLMVKMKERIVLLEVGTATHLVGVLCGHHACGFDRFYCCSCLVVDVIV